MLIITKKLAAAAAHDAELVLPFDLRQKSRLRASLADGEQVGLFLERGRILRDGDCLQGEDGRVVKVVAQPEKLLEVRCDTTEALMRVTYHLGNRHVPLQIGDGWVRIADDRVLKDMLEGLGADVRMLEAAFEPEPGAYGNHTHARDEMPDQPGVLHEYRDRAGSGR
jgi:urease accessory protein